MECRILTAIIDVRANMPNYELYKDWKRASQITGIAIHQSATVDKISGKPIGDALSLFDYQVNGSGLLHGRYHYVILNDGSIQYALDENIIAHHASFKDPSDSYGLENGHYWDNHYLAVCLCGWFSQNRSYQANKKTHPIPNNHTHLAQEQNDSLVFLLKTLQKKYNIPSQNIQGHRELAGNTTQCPGFSIDLDKIREQLHEQPVKPPITPPQSGEHVIVVPDTEAYLNAALGYIWKFQPDVSFNTQVVPTKWQYITVIGTIDGGLLQTYQQYGARLVQHIAGDAITVQEILDNLVVKNERFLPLKTEVT